MTGEAARTFSELPPGMDRSAKTVLGVYAEGVLVGVIDLVDGFPTGNTAMLGLLLIAGTHRRRGLGARSVGAVRELVATWGTCDRIRLAVVRDNVAGLAFWSAMGFSATGETQPWRQGSVESEIVVMESRLG